MGVGKTIQSLVAIALSHLDVDGYCNKHLVSLVVCPSSVVGHWMSEIDRFFPGGSVFKPIALIGNSTSRDKLWRKGLAGYNIVVTNYSVLRSDAKRLAKTFWKYCILDEGHLLKNPKTGTCMPFDIFVPMKAWISSDLMLLVSRFSYSHCQSCKAT